MSFHDEELLVESEIFQHVKANTFPRLSLSNNLPDRRTVGRINRSEMYSSLLKRPAASQDVIEAPPKADTMQQQAKPLLYDNQSLPKDTENTTGLLTTLY